MRRTALALLLAIAAGCSTSAPPPPAALPEPTTPSGRALREAMDAVWERALADSIDLRLRYGLPVEKLPDLSYAHAEEQVAFARATLDRLSAVRREELTEDETLSLDALSRDLRMAVEGHRYFWLGFPVTPYASRLPEVHRAFLGHRFAGPADAERYLRLLGEYPRLVDQLVAHLAGQLERGIVLPKEEIRLVVPLLTAYDRPADESLFMVAPERLSALPPAEAESFRERLREAIEGEVDPALLRLAWFISAGYESRAPDEVGLWQYPDGDAYYRYLVRLYTTLELTPEEVHERGLAEVERIGKQMAREQRLHGFGGPRVEFHRGLREDARFRARTAEEIGERLRAYVARIEPRVPEMFSLSPRAPYGVERLDAALEGTMTDGYYLPPSAGRPRGTYFYDGSQPGERSLLGAQSLACHELVPGHHLQIALQYENSALHPLRRESLPSGFVEGWAEYACDLGHELGLYDNLHDRYGRYAAEMSFALRLVVDTGMNHLRWPRSRAVELMRRESLESGLRLDTETLRYAVDVPGQALAYKIGAMKIQELRRRAEAELGPAFDLREFHRLVLGSGALPLSVLEAHVERYLAEKRQPTAP